MPKHKHLEKRSLLSISVFGLCTVVAVILCVIGLVSNSNNAKQRYETLVAADQAGGDVESALNDLRGYIYSHMNTQIGNDNGIRPPIQLKGTYDRLVTAEEARVTAANELLYNQAQEYCEKTQPGGFYGGSRLACIEKYIDENGEKPKQIQEDLYKFDFVPPRWSPDLAGFSMIFAILFGIIFTIDLVLYLRTRHMVRMAN